MTIQTQIHIGKVIRNAVAFKIKNWDGTPMNSDSLLKAVSELFALLDEKEVDYVLVGGIALLQYIEGRNTEDIDLIMSLSSLDALPQIEILSKDMYFVRGRFQNLQIDILLTDNPLFAKVQEEYSVMQNFAEQPIRMASVEGLLLLKLYALPSLYRQGNFSKVGIYENDIATLLHDHQTDTQALLDQLSAFLSAADLAEIQTILAEIEERISRFRGRSANH